MNWFKVQLCCPCVLIVADVLRTNTAVFNFDTKGQIYMPRIQKRRRGRAMRTLTTDRAFNETTRFLVKKEGNIFLGKLETLNT